MFAEEEIIGKSSVKISSSKRIILPKYCYAEEGDRILIMFDGTNHFLYSENKFYEIINELENKLSQAETKEEKKDIRLKIKILCHLVLEPIICDKQRRVNISRICDNGAVAELEGKNKGLIIKIR